MSRRQRQLELGAAPPGPTLEDDARLVEGLSTRARDVRARLASDAIPPELAADVRELASLAVGVAEAFHRARSRGLFGAKRNEVIALLRDPANKALTFEEITARTGASQSTISAARRRLADEAGIPKKKYLLRPKGERT